MLDASPRSMFCAAFRRFVVGGKRFSSAVRDLAVFLPKYVLLVQNHSIFQEAQLGAKLGFSSHSDFRRFANFIVFTNMSPRGKAKAKTETEENGKEKRVRESRNVKAASYKDLTDSEEEKPARRKKKVSESESISEEEKPKPKRKVTKGKRAPARPKKVASDSEEASDVTEESSDENSRKKRKSQRKPIRSLRTTQRTSYKDLSDSDEDSNVDQDEDMESASEKEESPKSSEKQKKGRGRGRPPKVPKEEDASDSEESSKKDGTAQSNEAGDNSGTADSSSDAGKVKSAATEKKDADSTVGKKERPEHEMSEEDGSDEEADTKKRARPAKKRDEDEEEEEEEEEKDEEPQAKKAKVIDKPALNKTGSDFGSIDFSSDAKTKTGDPWNFKISSWNAAGLKALAKKNGLDFIKYEKPDILCLQETKCSEKKLPPEAIVDGYHAYWLSGEKEGYAGVAILSKTKPIDVKYGLDKPEFDTEGRVITAEYDKFFLVNVYVPNAGQNLKTLPKRLEWDPIFRAHLKKLDEQKPVILCGDMNVAHSEIDLANPKSNVKNAGFTPQEREGLTQLLKEGFVDTFRHLYPDKTGAYSFWTYLSNSRSRNVGWRLDYFITSERFLPQVCDNVLRSEVYGSDHCPITLLINL